MDLYIILPLAIALVVVAVIAGKKITNSTFCQTCGRKKNFQNGKRTCSKCRPETDNVIKKLARERGKKRH